MYRLVQSSGFRIKRLFEIKHLFCVIYTLSQSVLWSQNCPGLVDAGPDQFTCDPAQMIQLQGVINGNPNSFGWTPATGLSSDKVLDPMVTIKVPGKYKYKLTAEVVGTTNFIVNGNFEGGYSGFSTEYVFKTLGQGFGPDNVAIATNPQAYNGGFQTCGDHTSGSGNMWLVDGSTQAGKKVWCQTVAVTPGNTYQFELYSMLVFPVAPSILEITVNGNPIGGGQVGALCDWTQMMACFKATTGSATICVSEITGVGYGNDFALDDIALYEKCIDEDEVEVEIVDLKAVAIIPLKPKCSSEIFDLFGTGSSGGPNITYEWTTDRGTIISQNGLTAKARGSGTYTIKVKYDNGNVHCEKEASIDYDAPEELTGLIQATGVANCALDTVIMNVIMNTGSGIYTYSWGPLKDILNGENTEMASVNKAQKYTVTVTDATTGCILGLEKQINIDTLKPVFKLTGDTLLDCKNKSAKLFSSLTDTNLYKIEWVLPDKNSILQNPSITSNQSGTYQLKIQNKNNKCLDSALHIINLDTLAPKINLGADLIIDCAQPNATINPLGVSNNPTKYFWNLPGGQNLTEDSLTSKTIGISGYVILLSINQKNGCSDLDSVFVLDNRKYPTLTLIKPDTLNCAVRSINLEASSTSVNTSILWSTVNGNISSGMQNLIATVTRKGRYYVTITDTSSKCSISDSIDVSEDISIPDAILGADLIFKCSDTAVIIDGSASTNDPRITYSWSTTNGQISTGQNTNQISVTKAGRYQLILLNNNNFCRDTATINVLNDNNKPTVSLSPFDTINCRINSITFNPSVNSSTGGTIIYNWTGDQNQNIQNNQTANPSVQQPGIYTLVVTDQSNGCTSSSQIVVVIDTLTPITNAGNDQILNCSVTKLTLDGDINNDPKMIYQWTTNNGKIINTSDPKTIEVQEAGTYRLTKINRLNGCVSFDDVSISVDTTKPLIIISPPDTLDCITKTVLINSSGSSNTPQMSYFWTSSAPNSIDVPNARNVNVNSKGNYTLTIINNQNGCRTTSSIQVFEDFNSPVLNINPALELTCKIRSLQLNANLQNIQDQIRWTTSTGNITSGANTITPMVSSPGWYYATATGRNGCIAVDSILVIEITNVPTDLNYQIDQPKCTGDVALLHSVSVLGGVSPLTFELDGVTIPGFPISNLNPGKHTLKVKDRYGCEFSESFDVITASPVSVAFPPDVAIDAGSSYQLNYTSSISKDSIASIEWSPKEKLSCSDCDNPTVLNLNEDTEFVITIISNSGCVATATIKIRVIRRGIWIPNVFSPNGDQINDYFYPFAATDSYKQIKLMQIFDRWGERVFHKENFQPNIETEGWNGQFKNEILNPGVYVYHVIIEWNNGETEILQGDLTLIR